MYLFRRAARLSWLSHSFRQVSWLVSHRIRPSSRFPSDTGGRLLFRYSDEFVQDSHLFPFSPDRIVRHLTLFV